MHYNNCGEISGTFHTNKTFTQAKFASLKTPLRTLKGSLKIWRPILDRERELSQTQY